MTGDLNVSDTYPQWSSDGVWVYFDRVSGGVGNPHRAYRVRADTDPLPPPLAEPVVTPSSSAMQATMPSSSPDRQIVVLGTGVSDLVTTTVDPTLGPFQTGIVNFADFTAKNTGLIVTLAPQLSPDGTRAAFRARPPGKPTELEQLWAVRRNTSLPPILSPIGSTVFFEGRQGQFTVSAYDPEADPIQYKACFLQLGMAFDTTTHTFSWTPPPGTNGKTYSVRFEVTTPANGGYDFEIVRIGVTRPPLGKEENSFAAESAENPSRGPFAVGVIPSSLVETAALTVFDVSGRLVTTIKGAPGTPLAWDTRDSTGRLVPSGLYFYRVQIGRFEEKGKWLLLR